MCKPVTAVVHALILTALAGCTSVSFKQGAGGEEFRRAQAACLGTTSERSAFTQCMEAKGWWTRSMEELSEIGLVPVDEEEAESSSTTSAASDPAAPASLAAPAGAPAAAPAAAPGTARASRPANAPAATPKDPLSKMRIAMWAKAGAGGAELMADQAHCLSTLGEAHQPDPLGGTVTRGLYDCLRKQGWSGMTLR